MPNKQSNARKEIEEIGKAGQRAASMTQQLLVFSRRQIEQVLMNLVVNARDSMTEGGKVTVRTENKVVDGEYCRLVAEARPGKYVCLSVEDTGSGMSKETISHIFKPFYTTKKEGSGTGLRLSVIYGIVKQHEGWINVYSEPGEGSLFRVYLPALLGKMEKEAEEEVSIEGLKGGRGACVSSGG